MTHEELMAQKADLLALIKTHLDEYYESVESGEDENLNLDLDERVKDFYLFEAVVFDVDVNNGR